MKQNQQQQTQRLKPTMGDNQQQQPPPQKCPRCESLNTKFCYYNNYSLSQPRYFCKNCRRYWTHGGTLRNVPVGGGCRKGKRTKNIISSADQQQQNLTSQQQSMIVSSNSGLISSSSGSYYPAACTGGFLSSLAAIQPMNQPVVVPPQLPFEDHQPNYLLNQGLSIGGGSSNLGFNLQHGYGTTVSGSAASFGSQPIQPITQFFQMGDTERSAVNTFSLDRQEGLLGNSSEHNWQYQSLIINNNNSTNYPTVSGAALWSINNNSSGSGSSTTAVGGSNTNTTNTTGNTSVNPNQWPHLPGYDAPP